MGQYLGVDELLRSRRQRQVQTDHIALPEKLFQRVNPADAYGEVIVKYLGSGGLDNCVNQQWLSNPR